MKVQLWAVSFANNIGDFYELKFVWHEQPSHEEAAARILQQHYAGKKERMIINIAREDLTPMQTKMKYLGYKIIDIGLADPSSPATGIVQT